jgi:peptidoglycan hydrolase CwlO-like protein
MAGMKIEALIAARQAEQRAKIEAQIEVEIQTLTSVIEDVYSKIRDLDQRVEELESA